MKKVLVISSSLRKGSNSDILAKEFAKGAKDAGNDVEYISLQGKNIAFCRGCLACQKKGKCVIKDDANEITEKMKNAEVIAFATPIYYYEMCGQLKTMLDRANSLYISEYKFREIYLLATAAENEKTTPKNAINGIKGWIACFDNVKLKGTVFASASEPKETASNKIALAEAYKKGSKV